MRLECKADGGDALPVVITELGNSFAAFKQELRDELAEERRCREDLERKANRLGLRAAVRDRGDAHPPERWVDAKTGRPIHALRHEHRLADLPDYQAPSGAPEPNLGRALRGLVLGSHAPDAKALREEFKALGGSPDTSGGVLLPDVLSAQFVDLLRAQMVLSRAGITLIPMPSRDVTVARLTGDPTVSWHGENSALTATEPTLGAINLSAKTAVCLVRFSLELSQDVANLEQQLQSVITSAMAAAVDAAGLVGVTTSVGAAPATGAGLVNLTGRSKVTSIGAPTSWDWVVDAMYALLAANVPLEQIGALVGHPAIFRKMRKLKTGLTNDNTPLTAPPEVAALPKYWTTAAPLSGATAIALLAKWDDVAMGVRTDITVRVLDQAFMGSNMQLALLVYQRCDFAALRPTSVCTCEGITTS